MDQSTTPGAGPGRTRSVGEAGQFTYGLIFDVVEVLEAHSYGPFDGTDYTALLLHLRYFLPGGTDRCYGKSAVVAGPAASATLGEPSSGDPSTGEAHWAEAPRKVTAPPESGAAVDVAPARDAGRRGLGL